MQPIFFTKVLKPLMGDLRKRGMRGLLYIDDKLTVGMDGPNCLFWFNQVWSLFEEAGLVFKPSKSFGLPSQYVVFLGLGIDSRDITFNIPDPKISRVVPWAEELLQQREVPVRNLAGLVGLL